MSGSLWSSARKSTDDREHMSHQFEGSRLCLSSDGELSAPRPNREDLRIPLLSYRLRSLLSIARWLATFAGCDAIAWQVDRRPRKDVGSRYAVADRAAIKLPLKRD